jgi:hypothetical protein
MLNLLFLFVQLTFTVHGSTQKMLTCDEFISKWNRNDSINKVIFLNQYIIQAREYYINNIPSPYSIEIDENAEIRLFLVNIFFHRNTYNKFDSCLFAGIFECGICEEWGNESNVHFFKYFTKTDTIFIPDSERKIKDILCMFNAWHISSSKVIYRRFKIKSEISETDFIDRIKILKNIEKECKCYN